MVSLSKSRLNRTLYYLVGTVFAYGVTSSGKTHTMHVSSYLVQGQETKDPMNSHSGICAPATASDND
jgi:hypothetical protein